MQLIVGFYFVTTIVATLVGLIQARPTHATIEPETAPMTTDQRPSELPPLLPVCVRVLGWLIIAAAVVAFVLALAWMDGRGGAR